MDPFVFLAILLFGIFSGALGAMLGLGGGVLMIVFFILALNIPPHQAVALSLLAVIASSSVGGSAYVKSGLTNIRLSMLLEIFAVTGAIFGAVIALILPIIFTEVILALVLIYAAIIMIKSPKSEVIVTERKGILVPCGEFFDNIEKRVVKYCPTNMIFGQLVSLVSGGISGIVGIGGGVIMMPVLNLIMKVPMRAAAATSNFMVGVTAAASAFVYFNRGFLDLYTVVPAVLGTMAGAYIGTIFLGRTKSLTLKRLLGSVLAFVALLLIMKALGVVSW
jgi:hypothetical protein